MTESGDTAKEWLISEVSRGAAVDFALSEKKDVEAAFLTELFLGRCEDHEGNFVTMPAAGLRIIGATIIGAINLENAAGPDGGELPFLALENCEIAETINLRSARLRGLSLRASRICELLADYAHVSGIIDIRSVRPHPDSGRPGIGRGAQHLCRISLCGATIGDGIDAADAQLVGPIKDDSYVKYSERAPYALDLPEAKINGDIRLFPDFIASGGVNVNGAQINGSFQAHGAQLINGQLYALDGSGAVIRGNLALDSRVISAKEHRAAREKGKKLPGAVRSVCEGQLRLHNAIIEEDLRLHGAQIKGRYGRIAAEHVTIRGDAYMCAFDDARGQRISDGDTHRAFVPAIFEFECDQTINLRGANITGDINCRGADLRGNLDVSDARVGGHMLFSPQPHRNKALQGDVDRNPNLAARFRTQGDIELSGSEVRGDLYFQGAFVKGRIRGYGLRVTGYGNFAPFVSKPDGFTVWPFEIHGPLVLEKAAFGRKLDMSGALLRDELLAPNLQVGGKLLMSASAPESRPDLLLWFEASQRVNLSGASIQSDFDLTGAKLRRGLRFRGGRVESALIIDLFDIDYDGRPEHKRSIDLFNAHANVISDLHYAGDRLGYGESYFLRLEGFTYGRFPYSRDFESLSLGEQRRRRIVRERLAFVAAQAGGEQMPIRVETEERSLEAWLPKRLEWLNLQYQDGKPNAKNYNPDPYNALYSLYKRMGAQIVADKVLFIKLQAQRQASGRATRILFWPAEKLFGYGLKPVWAFTSYTIFVTVLLAVVWHADNRLGLVLEPGAPINRLVTRWAGPSPDGALQAIVNFTQSGRTFAIPKAKKGRLNPETQKPCSTAKRFYGAFIYTAETVVPSLDLKEREHCDFVEDSGWLWQWFKVLAMLVGWFMTTATVITLTGLFRRNVEP